MSLEAETKPAGDDSHSEAVPKTGWSWKKIVTLIVLAFAAHLAFLFIFGAKKNPTPRVVTAAPQFELATGDPELIALDDPTLFALPHIEDFAPAVWRNMPDIAQPSFRWTEPPPFLPPPAESLGATFNVFMQTNRFVQAQFNLKPEPILSAPDVPVISMLPTVSTVRVGLNLAHRNLLEAISVPTLTNNDVIAPSRVQVLVDTNGWVVSDVLLGSSDYDKADQLALALARAARFAPANQLMFGDLIFHWHTVPEPAGTNHTPSNAP